VALFAGRHGALALPVESHEMSLAHEAEGMGAVAVVVAFPLKVALEGSAKCPTVAKLRGDFYDSMLKVRRIEHAQSKRPRIEHARSERPRIEKNSDRPRIEKSQSEATSEAKKKRDARCSLFVLCSISPMHLWASLFFWRVPRIRSLT
jgi:hypothetical protein